MRFETVSGKARIAANSRTIGKIRNAAGGRFGLIDAVHELIRGSLSALRNRFWLYSAADTSGTGGNTQLPDSRRAGLGTT